MAANSFGSFGSFKLLYLEEGKKVPKNTPIDVTTVSHAITKDIEYFQKNLSRPASRQFVNYTWEKPSDESPSIYTQNKSQVDNMKHQNTLELMMTHQGYPHVVKQSEWETDPNGPPDMRSYPQKRRTVVLSSMTQYIEEMNKAFPGGQ